MAVLTFSGSDGSTASVQVQVPGELLIARVRLAALPMSGTAWAALQARADWALNSNNMVISGVPATNSPWLPNYHNSDGVGRGCVTLACALVAARTGDPRYRDRVIAICRSIIGSEDSASTNGTGSVDVVLATMRQISGYVLAADLVDMDRGVTGSRAGYTQVQWEPWLSALRTKNIAASGYRSIVANHARENNWGGWAAAALTTIGAYLNDVVALDAAAERMKRWLGEPSTAGPSLRTTVYDASFAQSSTQTAAVNPAGPTSGKNGILVDDASRSAQSYATWSTQPSSDLGVDYSFEGLVAQMTAAVMLHRRGYDVFGWADRALLRAMQRLDSNGWVTGNTRSAPRQLAWIMNYVYGASFAVMSAGTSTNTLGHTDWWLSPAP